MQTGFIPGAGLSTLLIVYLVLPGLCFTKAYIIGIRKADMLDQWDKIGYVLAGSVLSGLILIAFYTEGMGKGPVTADYLEGVTMYAFLSGVGLQSLIAALLGILLGESKYCFSEDEFRTFNDREQPWQYTAAEIREKQVLITTDSGNEIEGIVARYRSGDRGGSLVLSPVSPSHRHVLRQGSDESNAAYIDRSDISQVHYIDDEEKDEYSEVLPHGDLDIPEDEGEDDLNESMEESEETLGEVEQD